MIRSAPLLIIAVTACGQGGPTTTFEPPDLSDLPLPGLDAQQEAVFLKGDELFELFLREGDGLGPLYTQAACGQCHAEDARGPGLVQKFIVVMPDGVTPAADQSRLMYGHTEHPLTTAGASTPILAPRQDLEVRVSVRVGPPVMGRGYLEAIGDDTLKALAAEQATRDDGIRGRVNWVTYASEPNLESPYNRNQKGDRVIGRFGLKARIATLDEFTADALQGDMGITSPLRPNEIRNPDGMADDLKPGVDVTLESVNARADYMRLLRIPRRGELSPAGRAAFEKARCDGCHVSALTTRPDYPLPQLRGVEAPVFTDLLLHDMGVGLADSMQGEDGLAGPRDWRTAPLIGLRFLKHFLHDSRADTVEQAIAAHASDGSEANDSVARFDALSDTERAALLDFVNAL
jgi:CxxC motif-containing protein (DUF1111 family)